MNPLLTSLCILTLFQQIAAKQTFLTVTRLRAHRGTPLQCNKELLDSTSSKYRELEVDICESLTRAAGPLQISVCSIHSSSCDSNRVLVSSRVELQTSSLTTQQLHLSFKLSDLIKAQSISIDSLQVRDYDECVSATHDCSVNSVCKNSVGSYSCACKIGYVDGSTAPDTGRVCNVQCGTNTCVNGGTCSSVGGVSVCKCGKEFTGKSCEVRKKDVEWVWIFGITIVVSTLILVPALVCFCIYIRTRRRSQSKNNSYKNFN